MAPKNMQNRRDINRTLYNELFPERLNRAEARKLKILEAAIETYAQLHVNYVSYEDIARSAQMSRPLVQHHFPDKVALFIKVVQLIRALMQRTAVEAISKASDSPAQMEAYVRATFSWLRENPVHGQAWLFFLYGCPTEKRLRQLHIELARVGEQRIAALIKGGLKKIADRELRYRSKSVQRLISGGLIEFGTECEPTDTAHRQSIEEDTVRNVLEIAGL